MNYIIKILLIVVCLSALLVGLALLRQHQMSNQSQLSEFIQSETRYFWDAHLRCIDAGYKGVRGASREDWECYDTQKFTKEQKIARGIE